MSQDDRTPETEEVKDQSTEETTEESTEETKEETLTSLHNNEKPKVPEAIPYDRFKEVNDESKAKDAIIAELTEKLESSNKPATKAEANRGLAEIAKEHNLDPDILGKVAESIKAEALASVQQEIAPITEARKQAEADKVFETMYKSALENNPEYTDVVNKDVIKQLAFNPANKNKTFSQLLKEVYGSVAKSGEQRKTMEQTQKGKPESIDTIDFKRAQSDTEYFRKIMADPQLKATYNEHNMKEISKRL